MATTLKTAKRNQPFKDWWDSYAKRYPDDAGYAAYLAARDAWKAATKRAKK